MKKYLLACFCLAVQLAFVSTVNAEPKAAPEIERSSLFQWEMENNLYEAWGGWDITPALHLRVGQVKVALSTEFATRPENLPSIDYAFSSYLDGRYDPGVQLDGLLLDNAFWYQGSATARIESHRGMGQDHCR